MLDEPWLVAAPDASLLTAWFKKTSHLVPKSEKSEPPLTISILPSALLMGLNSGRTVIGEIRAISEGAGNRFAAFGVPVRNFAHQLRHRHALADDGLSNTGSGIRRAELPAHWSVADRGVTRVSEESAQRWREFSLFCAGPTIVKGGLPKVS